MKNWSGSVEWQPSQILIPSSEKQVQEIVKNAITNKQKVRVIGTGHSFTALCKTDDILISLDKYQGIVSEDKEKHQATVKAGTKLSLLGNLLFEKGLAMENLGDIDVQSIAGTISTGTHGTGINFGTISTQVIGLKFINGKGEIISCSATENSELFKAMQVSLGVFGIVLEVTLQCIPTYRLKLENKRENIDEVLANLENRKTNNRNFEFYWIPYTKTAWTKTSNTVKNTAPDKVNFFNYWTEFVLENYVFKVFCELARWFPKLNKTVANITAKSISNVSKVYHSHKVYATQRMVKFHEMEYNIPASEFKIVMQKVMDLVNSKQFNIHFPIECRWVKGDDILLSPAFGRDSAYIACHVYNKKEYKPYFKALEAIFQAHGGRPHWGKMNTLTAVDVAKLYPKHADFMHLRNEQDPYEVFMTPYMKQLLNA